MLALIPSSRNGMNDDQHDHRHGHDGNSRAGEMPQEYQDDQHHCDDHLEDGDLQIADRTMNEFGTVIDGNDLDAFRQCRA